MPDLFFDLGIDDFRFDRDALYVGWFFFSSKILSSKISNRDVRHKFFFCIYSGMAKRNCLSVTGPQQERNRSPGGRLRLLLLVE